MIPIFAGSSIIFQRQKRASVVGAFDHAPRTTPVLPSVQFEGNREGGMKKMKGERNYHLDLFSFIDFCRPSIPLFRFRSRLERSIGRSVGWRGRGSLKNLVLYIMQGGDDTRTELRARVSNRENGKGEIRKRNEKQNFFVHRHAIHRRRSVVVVRYRRLDSSSTVLRKGE